MLSNSALSKLSLLDSCSNSKKLASIISSPALILFSNIQLLLLRRCELLMKLVRFVLLLLACPVLMFVWSFINLDDLFRRILSSPFFGSFINLDDLFRRILSSPFFGSFINLDDLFRRILSSPFFGSFINLDDLFRRILSY
uniref:Uncharacterized protein n=1 Tax=Globodera rostochiensis TaxID=31243 RepID=A0A914I028_GLORO